MIKSRQFIWLGHVAHMEEMRKTQNDNQTQNLKERDDFGRPGFVLEKQWMAEKSSVLGYGPEVGCYEYRKEPSFLVL